MLQQFLHDPRYAPMRTECTAKLFEFEAVERRSLALLATTYLGGVASIAGALVAGAVANGAIS